MKLALQTSMCDSLSAEWIDLKFSDKVFFFAYYYSIWSELTSQGGCETRTLEKFEKFKTTQFYV